MKSLLRSVGAAVLVVAALLLASAQAQSSTPADPTAVNELQKLGEKADQTNTEIESAHRSIWWGIGIVAFVVLARVVLPRVLTHYLGPEESTKVLTELAAIREALHKLR